MAVVIALLWGLAAGLAAFGLARGIAAEAWWRRMLRPQVNTPSSRGTGGPWWLRLVLTLPPAPGRRAPAGVYGPVLAQAGLDVDAQELARREPMLGLGAGLAGMAALAALASGSGSAPAGASLLATGAACAAAAPLGLRMLLRRCAAGRQRLLLAQVPALVDLLIMGLESGLTVRQVLGLAARHAPPVWRGPCARMLAQSQHGLALDRAYAGLRDTLAPGPARAVLRVLSVAERAGASQAELLRREGDHARALLQQAWQARVNALPLQLLVVGVLLLFPPVLVLLLLPNLLTFAGSRW